MQTVRIIAAIVDTRELTLYRADGETIKIPQGDPRIRPLVQKVIPELQRLQGINAKLPLHNRVPVYVDLTDEQLNQTPTFENTQTHYAEAEKKMGGLVKFLRIAKSKLKELVDKVTGAEAEPVEPTDLVGHIPAPANHAAIVGQVVNVYPPAKAAPVAEELDEEEEGESEDDHNAKLSKGMAIVDEIMANAVPSHSPQFAEGAKDKEQTIVAVLEDGTVIPNMEHLDLQLRHTAEKLGNPVGILKFFERVSKVERAHSVADLLKFMEKGELPIADDGSILVYKRLQSTKEPGVFVDCHTRKVKQRVGSHVFMDEKLVDPNRRTECSNGLHVARRDYLTSFSGDITVLAKLAPEDVIAVPHADARKLRAKGYFIIAQLSSEDASNVCSNRKLTDTNLLGNAVAGNHTPIIETVQITEQRGGGVIITPVNGEAEFISDAALSASPLRTEEDILDENKSVNARELGRGSYQAVEIQEPNGPHSAKVEDEKLVVTLGQAKAEVVEKFVAKLPTAGLSKVQQLVKDFEDANTPETKLATAQALVAHKKSVKKSWTALGVTAATADAAMTRANAPVTAAEAVKPVKASSKKPAEKAKPSAGTKETKTPVKAKAPAKPAATKKPSPLKGKSVPAVKPKAVVGKAPTKADIAMDLWDKAMGGGATGKKAAQELLDFKKKAKKGWEVLGLRADAGDELNKLVK